MALQLVTPVLRTIAKAAPELLASSAGRRQLIGLGLSQISRSTLSNYTITALAGEIRAHGLGIRDSDLNRIIRGFQEKDATHARLATFPTNRTIPKRNLPFGSESQGDKYRYYFKITATDTQSGIESEYDRFIDFDEHVSVERAGSDLIDLLQGRYPSLQFGADDVKFEAAYRPRG